MVVCSAVKKDGIVYVGRRHNNIRDNMVANGISFKGCEQGFLDKEGRFLNRTEAAIDALACGQIKELKFSETELFSEDLY